MTLAVAQTSARRRVLAPLRAAHASRVCEGTGADVVKGMILAAGYGSRLMPLTQLVPKPLLPVANMPTMAYGIRTLRALGIRDICVNVSYMRQEIRRHFGDGEVNGVTLHWSEEETPLGTAGGVKRASPLLKACTTVVIAGDAVLDCDLRPLVAAHRRRDALITLGSISVDDPRRYGVIVTDTQGRIQQYQEKPAPGEEISRQASTGIYILSPDVLDIIPDDRVWDFGLDVFPEIIASGAEFYACPVVGYWTDVGSPAAYLEANLDYLAGRIRVEASGRRVGDNLVSGSAQVDGASLRRCVVGEHVSISQGSDLVDCVVWPGTRLVERTHAVRAVLTPRGIYEVRADG